MRLQEWRQRFTKALTDARMHRRGWTSEQRIYIEVRIPHASGYVQVLQSALEAVPGVAWARVNGALGRVVVAFSGEPVASERLIHIVDAVEREFGLGPISWEGRRAFPGDAEPMLRFAIEMGTDAVVFGLGVTMRVFGVKTVPAELDFAALTSLAEFVPQLRERVEQRLGPARGELALHFASALSTAMVQGTTGPLVDAVGRALRIREYAAYGDAWMEHEPALGGEPEQHECPAPALGERPGAPPRGPIEHYTSRALAATMGAFGFSFVASRDLAGSTASVFGGVPKPALAGREAFAADLGHALARHGVIVMNPKALRALDRINAIVIEARSLRPRGVRVEGIAAVNGFNERDARRNTMRMLDLADVTAVREDGNWRLGPIDKLRRARPVAASAEIERQIGALRRPGGQVIGLEHKGELAALLSLIPMPDPAVEAFVTAARRAKLLLVCAGELDERQRWFEPDRMVPAGDQLLDSIHTLQRDGHGVCLIGEEPSAALVAADLGVGLRTHTVPWGASLICNNGFADVEAVIEAVHAAKQASQQSVYLAMVEAVSGLILSVGGIRERTVRRVMMAANAASLLAMANGVRLARGVHLDHLRPSDEAAPWHALEVDQVLEKLHSSPAGLTPELAAERRRPTSPEPSPWTRFGEMMLDEFASPFSPILVAGAGLAALTGGIVDSLLIAGVVGFNTAIGAMQRYRTDQAISALDASEGQRARVRRAGDDVEIELQDLVVGDVLVLEAGDAVPADARIIEATGLELDESSLTGESLPVSKREAATFATAVADRISMVFEGTSIAAGKCLAVVTAVGEDTEARRGSARARQAPKSGVEARLEELTNFTGPIAAASGVTLMTSGLSLGRPASEVISSGVSLAVAAVPEGLPLLATMAQLGAARRLSTRGALVRNPRAVEALGRVNLLCADKTGTLTEGQIRLRLVSDGTREAGLDQLDDGLLEILRAAMRASPTEETDSLPHATDRALVDGAHKCGLHRSADAEQFERLSELPFEPARGYHAVHGRMLHEHEGREYLSIKGAPERVIPLCTTEGSCAAAIDDATLDERVEQTVVFARVTPAQKVRIVRALQTRGRIVGMTGDGANDAPAIRLANVGIALGERATPAARRAADVVVTDERIETLVDAVLEGRALWRSVRDAVALLVGGNLGEIAFTVVGGVLEGRSPLNARQLLLVNMMTDTVPALAIALRRPPRTAPEQLLREGPEASLGEALNRDIAWRATVTAGATSAAWLVARAMGSRKRADTIALLTLVGSQLGQALAIGGRDPTVLAAGLGSAGLLLALVETPGVSQFFGSRPLGPIALGHALITSAAATGVALAGPRVLDWARDADFWPPSWWRTRN